MNLEIDGFVLQAPSKTGERIGKATKACVATSFELDFLSSKLEGVEFSLWEKAFSKMIARRYGM